MKTKVAFLSLILFISASLVGQTLTRQVISSIGSSTNATGNYVSHTIGQPTPPTSTTTNDVALRQGFEQPPKIKIIKKNDQMLNLSINPNPNHGAFQLTVDTKEANETYTFEIYDLQGKLMQTGTGIGRTQRFIELPSGTARSVYLIKVTTTKGDTGDGKVIVIGY